MGRVQSAELLIFLKTILIKSARQSEIFFIYILISCVPYIFFFLFNCSTKNIIQPYLNQLNSEAERPIIKACAKLAFQEINGGRTRTRKKKGQHHRHHPQLHPPHPRAPTMMQSKTTTKKKKSKKTKIPETQNPDPLQLSDNFFTQSE